MWGTWPYAHYGILYPVTSVSSAHYTHYPVISVPSFPVPSYLRESSPLWRQPSMMEPPVLWLIFLVSDWPISKYGVREASVICHLSSDLLKIDFQKWKTVVTLPGGEKIDLTIRWFCDGLRVKPKVGVVLRNSLEKAVIMTLVWNQQLRHWEWRNILINFLNCKWEANFGDLGSLTVLEEFVEEFVEEFFEEFFEDGLPGLLLLLLPSLHRHRHRLLLLLPLRHRLCHRALVDHRGRG